MKAHPEVGLHLRGAQGQAGLLILLGHRPKGRFRHIDDGGQDHDGQHNDGRQQAGAGAQIEPLLNGGHQHDHAHQAVHHGGNARQQLHRRADHGRQLRRGHLGQEHRRHQSDGHAHHNGSGGAVDRGEDKGKNAVLGPGGGVGGVPYLAEEELHQADLPDGRQAG